MKERAIHEMLNAIAEALDNAKYLGSGYVQIQRLSDGTYKFESLDPTMLIRRIVE